MQLNHIPWQFFHLILSFGSISSANLDSSRSRYNLFVRCTRRFTPGMCLEPVETVWSFVFQIQNCTEHLGCPPERRNNRFQTHKRCMKRCKPLVDIYTAILAEDLNNLNDYYLRSGTWETSGRRDIESEDTELEASEDYADNTNGLHVDGPAPNPLEDDSNLKYHEFPPDIDYVETEHDENDLVDHEFLQD